MKDERLIRCIEDHRFFVIIFNAISCWIKTDATFIKVQSKNDIVPSSSKRIKMREIATRFVCFWWFRYERLGKILDFDLSRSDRTFGRWYESGFKLAIKAGRCWTVLEACKVRVNCKPTNNIWSSKFCTERLQIFDDRNSKK